MRICNGYDSAAQMQYLDVRGPTGERYKAARIAMYLNRRQRFTIYGTENDKRLMRNARKLERKSNGIWK